MKIVEWGERLIGPLRSVLVKLSASQRISLVVLAITVSVGMGLLVFTGGGSRETAVVANMGINPQAAELLEAQGIDYKIDKATLDVTVAASRQDDVYAAGVSRALDTESDEFDWVFESQGWQESIGRQRLRSIESTRKRLEKAFAASKNIKRAVISVHKSPAEDWTIGRNQRAASASVIVTPATSKGISDRQAHMIASTIAGAFKIPITEIKVADNERVYDTSNPESALGTHSGEREQSVAEKVRSHYAEFQSWEIRVSVNVKTDPSSATVVSTHFKEDASFFLPTESMTETRETNQPAGLDPGVARNVAALNRGTPEIVPAAYRESHKVESTRNVPAISSEKQETVRPPNQVRQMNILVSFSERAIRNLLKANRAIASDDPASPTYNPTNEEVKEYVKQREEELTVFFSDEVLPTVVRAVSFLPPAPLEFASAEEPQTWAQFAMAHVRELVLGVLALCACFLVYRIAFSSIPELEQLPDPVAEITMFLKEREEQERQMAQARAEAERTGAEPDSDDLDWRLGREDQDMVDLLELVTGRADQEPNAAAAVVKNWIRNADQESKS